MNNLRSNYKRILKHILQLGSNYNYKAKEGTVGSLYLWALSLGFKQLQVENIWGKNCVFSEYVQTFCCYSLNNGV